MEFNWLDCYLQRDGQARSICLGSTPLNGIMFWPALYIGGFSLSIAVTPPKSNAAKQEHIEFFRVISRQEFEPGRASSIFLNFF